MLLWIGFAVLTAAVVAALMRPLLRREPSTLDLEAADIAVYRDQLAAIETDRERGVLGPAETQSARAEIGRRLLERARHDDGDASRPRTVYKRISGGMAFATAALVPVLGVAIYFAVGSPGMPGRPHAGRAALPVEQASIDEIVAQVEARLRQAPDDGRGWDVIAPVYVMQQRYRDAAEAYTKAIALLGEEPKRLAGLAESAIRAENGIVGDAARRAYEKLLAVEPERLDAQFWIAVAKEQDGDLPGAANAYRDVIAKAETEDAPWRKPAVDRLKAIEEKLGSQPADGGAVEQKPVN